MSERLTWGETWRRWVYSPPRRRGFVAGLVAGVVLTLVLSWAFRPRSGGEGLAERTVEQAERVKRVTDIGVDQTLELLTGKKGAGR